MAKMTGRELLNSLLEQDEEIRRKIDKLDELRALAIGITASTDKESIQTSGDKDRIGNIVSKIADLENEINLLTDGYIARKNIAKRIILKMSNENYQNILYDFYICRRKLYEIADEYDMNYDKCRVYKSKAIKVFEKMYNTR